MDIHGSLTLIVANFHFVVVVPTVHFALAVVERVTIWQVR
jgi:hypothetical protein